MQNAVVGTVVSIALVVGLVLGWMATSNADAQRPRPDSAGRAFSDHFQEGQQLVALSTEVDERRVQITIIDPQTRALVVYHIDKPSGEVSLRSVRNVHWDLQMDEFNGKNPLPREIRSLLQSR